MIKTETTEAEILYFLFSFLSKPVAYITHNTTSSCMFKILHLLSIHSIVLYSSPYRLTNRGVLSGRPRHLSSVKHCSGIVYSVLDEINISEFKL